MTSSTFNMIAGAAALAVASTTTLHADAPAIRYHSQAQGHHVLVEGTSNVHDWSGTSEKIRGWIEVPGEWIDRDGELRLEPALGNDEATPRVHVQLPVAELEGNRRGLASNMHDALEASKHPNVTFTLVEITRARSAGAGTVWSALGNLNVAGTTRRIELELTLTPLADGRLRIDVERGLKMTDFGIDPPRAMMGMARAADDVQVRITWLVQRHTPQPTIASAPGSAEQLAAINEILEAYEQARSAVETDALTDAQAALATLAEQATTLAAIDNADLDEAAATAWASSSARLQGAAVNAAEANTLAAARAAFAVLSQSLVQTIEIIGHDHDTAVLVYRHGDQTGLAGAPWLQLDNGAAVRTPYGPRSATLAEIVAVHPPTSPR